MAQYRVQAYNTATASANRMHDDVVAAQYGFAGGLVPGVDVWAYLTHPVVEAWGTAWLERGTMSARFLKPVYDGQEVLVDFDPPDLRATDPEGTVCATGTASLPEGPSGPPERADRSTVPEAPSTDRGAEARAGRSVPQAPGEGRGAEAGAGNQGPQPAPQLSAFPLAPLPDDPPPATPESLGAIGVLGSVKACFDLVDATGYLLDVREDLPLYRTEEVAHPGWLLRLANRLLAENVVLPPWIHVSSDVRHLGLVRVGETVTARGRVAGLAERKGHRFVDLDVLLVAEDDRPVLQARHTAIYQPRRTEG